MPWLILEKKLLYACSLERHTRWITFRFGNLVRGIFPNEIGMV
jgi:hypothetical protein